MSVARDLARFAVARKAADLPPEAYEYAAMLVASTLSSAALGSSIDSTRIIRRLAWQQGGSEEASVWFETGSKLPVAVAARVNAVMSDSAASDDSDLRNIVHPGTPLVATTLALAERLGSRGEDVLAAIILGYEVQARLGGALTPGFRDLGFHGCIIAVFGSTVAAGRLLGLEEDAMTNAIALAATSIGGMMAAANTSVAREYHAGLATLLGIEAAQAAAAGFTCEERIIEMPHGFIDLHGGGDASIATTGLGERWSILKEIAIKVVPGAHQFHASAEAAAQAAIAGDVRPEDVERIVVSRPGIERLTGPVHPTDLIGMAHSAAYFAAAGVADRDFSWQHASMAKISDPVIGSLLEKVEIGEPETEDVERYKQGAKVTIHLNDGRTFAATVFVPRGSGERGVSWADVDEKFRVLFPNAELPATRPEEVLSRIHRLRGEADLSALMRLLAP